MSASICPRCTGYVAAENADGDWCCINCGHVIYRNQPLPLVKTVAGSNGSLYDRSDGKPLPKKPGLVR